MKLPVKLFIIINNKAAEPFQKALGEIIGLPAKCLVAKISALEISTIIKRNFCLSSASQQGLPAPVRNMF